MAALSDSATTVAELKARVLAFVRERDWEQFHSPKNLSMALAAEAGELMEHFLWATPEQSQAVVADAAKRGKIADELPVQAVRRDGGAAALPTLAVVVVEEKLVAAARIGVRGVLDDRGQV